MGKPYIPKPIDTSGVEVPPELEQLSEYLAKNTHEVWARQRLDSGWTWGETRDSQARTHPDLVPYEELPESEKLYDRQTSMETLKVIISLGYRLVKA